MYCTIRTYYGDNMTKLLHGPAAAQVLRAHAIEVDRQGLSWSLDPTTPAEATVFRVNIEGNDQPTVVFLREDGSWHLAR